MKRNCTPVHGVARRGRGGRRQHRSRHSFASPGQCELAHAHHGLCSLADSLASPVASFRGPCRGLGNERLGKAAPLCELGLHSFCGVCVALARGLAQTLRWRTCIRLWFMADWSSGSGDLEVRAPFQGAEPLAFYRGCRSGGPSLHPRLGSAGPLGWRQSAVHPDVTVIGRSPSFAPPGQCDFAHANHGLRSLADSLASPVASFLGPCGGLGAGRETRSLGEVCPAHPCWAELCFKRSIGRANGCECLARFQRAGVLRTLTAGAASAATLGSILSALSG